MTAKLPPMTKITIEYPRGPRVMRGPFTIELDDHTADCLNGLAMYRGGGPGEYLSRLIREAYRQMMTEPRFGGVPPRWSPLEMKNGRFAKEWAEMQARGVIVHAEGVPLPKTPPHSIGGDIATARAQSGCFSEDLCDRIRRAHRDGCVFRMSVLSVAGFPCEKHQLDVCPVCDPCTCTFAPSTEVAQ